MMDLKPELQYRNGRLLSSDMNRVVEVGLSYVVSQHGK